MQITNKDLKKRIIEISYKLKLSHIGSCLTAVDIIDDIYQKKKKDEPFILSSGHAGLALYCVIEKYEGINAEFIFKHHGVHPDRCGYCNIVCSSGSLGHGLGIALGMALADRSKNVYCLISDGECAEGSIFEALRITGRLQVNNLIIYCNRNGWGAYMQINDILVPERVKVIYTNSEQLPFLKGQDAHYYVMDEKDYETAMSILS